MNEGDCDSDSDCAGSLICRNRNDGKDCPSNFPSSAECCQKDW